MTVILVKDVSFVNLDGIQVTIPSNTKLQIDTDDNSASAMGYHFDITEDEYTPVH